jgi:hypothetical protein
MKEKLNLGELKVKSFVIGLESEAENTVKGGVANVAPVRRRDETIPPYCPDGKFNDHDWSIVNVCELALK